MRIEDELIAEHARDLRCPHAHGYTVETTTCPIVLDLVRIKEAHAALDRQAAPAE